MPCPCCNQDPCPRCGTCTQTWGREYDEDLGEFVEGWGYGENDADCSGSDFTDEHGVQWLNALVIPRRCSCTIANRAGNFVGEVISGLCVTDQESFCRCCTATFEEGAWEKDEGCEGENNAIFAHGAGFVVRAICTCPDPVGTAEEGETVQLDCVGSYYCDPPHPDCADP